MFIILILVSLIGFALSILYFYKSLKIIELKNKGEKQLWKKVLRYPFSVIWYSYLIIFFICLTANNVFAVPNVNQNNIKTGEIFKFDTVNLGMLQQGVKKNVEIKGKNISKDNIELENVFNQMVGGENFVYPKEIKAGQDFKISFTLNTAYMEGDFLHNIILVNKGGKAFSVPVSGKVENPIVLSERYLDLGYYKNGNRKNWIFYVWDTKGSLLNLKLKADSNKEFKAEFSNVKLDINNFDNIKEGGNTPAIKVNLSVLNLEKPNNAQKSIRKMVSFICENYPDATPELMITGYWL